MRKIPTMFVRDWDGTLGPPARFVLDERHPDCEWVFAGEGIATRKYDGSCCLILGEALYKRREVKPGQPTPDGFTMVELDVDTGKLIGWLPVGLGPDDQWHREALAELRHSLSSIPDGTYELLGPKVRGNPERLDEHLLLAHADAERLEERAVELTYDGVRDALATLPWEGIVWHHPDGRMAKIKGKDFGLERADG